MYRRPNKGAKPKLTPEQFKELPSLLKQGVQAFGYWDEVWTRDRVCAVVQKRFGVRYHPTQMGHILRKIGWTPQKPVLRSAERVEAGIERWKKEEWPSLKKSG